MLHHNKSTLQRVLLLWLKLHWGYEYCLIACMKKRLNSIKSGNVIARSKSVLASTKFIIFLSALILSATLVGWQYHNTTNADRIFWGMVDNNFQLQSYVRQNTQKSGAQSVDQIIATSTQPKQVVYSETLFEQTGADATQATTENIGTPYRDYVRYTNITTAQKNAAGSYLQFNDALNVWGASETADASISEGQLYNNSVLGFIPTGNLSAADRRELIKQLRDSDAYSYKIVQTNRSGIFGRPDYRFEVQIDPVPYITVIKAFASKVGLNHLEEVDPQQYSDAGTLSFVVHIDGWSHLLTQSSQAA